MNTKSDLKGITCVVDHCSHTVDPLDLGTREQLHDGRIDSPPLARHPCDSYRQNSSIAPRGVNVKRESAKVAKASELYG